MTKTNDELAKKFFEMDGDVTGSFTQATMSLSQTELQSISNGLDCGNITFFSILPTRKFTLAFNQDDFHVFPGQRLPKSLTTDYKTQTDNYFTYLIQSNKGMFLVLGSMFDFLGFLSKRTWNNPFDEEDQINRITQKISSKMNLKNIEYYPGENGVSINVFESEKGFKFFALQI